MTVIVAASSPAPVVTPVAAHAHALENKEHGFSATLDALTAGEGKAKSSDGGERRKADDAADAAPARSTADLRVALMGGALASLSTPSKVVADTASPAGSARATPSALQSDSKSDPSAQPIVEAGRPAAAAKSVPKATLTAERAYIAPAAFANALVGQGREAPAAPTQAQALALAISTPGATARGQRGAETGSTPLNAAAAAPPAGDASAAEPDGFGTGPAATGARSARDRVATAPVGPSAPAAAASGGPGGAAPSESVAAASSAAGVEPQPTAGTALARSPRPVVRATAAAHASGAGSAAHSPSAAPTVEAKTDASEGARRGAAGEQAINGSLQAGASTNPFGAAAALAVPTQSDTASSTPSDPSGAPAAQTRASTAAVPTAQRVHEIDLDLAPGGVADASMTVRLAGDKLGVIIRAVSGETTATIQGARDAIAERLAAIGQPVSSIIIQQADANDATGGSGQSAAEGEGRERQNRNGEADDSRGSRHGGFRF